MYRKIATSDLRIGMYVASLDRPWVETSFLFQGVRLARPEEIQHLQETCSYVYIDHARSDWPDQDDRSFPPPPRKALCTVLREYYGSLQHYEDAATAEQERVHARQAWRNALETVEQVWSRIGEGQPLLVPEVQQAVNGVIESVVRNPDAFLWLRQLELAGGYNYQHAVGCCGLAVAFGRQLGIPREGLAELGLGAMLLDIGKLRLPRELLEKRDAMTEQEMACLRAHVEKGVAMLRRSGKVPQAVLEMVRYHHERFNGEGYPEQLRGENIPVVARIAAIIDCYDAITSERVYCKAIHPGEAIRLLYEWRGIDFQEELIEQFIQCLGIYPTGSLVELNNGEVGIVLAQNRSRRLRPRVLMVLDAAGRPFGFAPVRDLAVEGGEEAPVEIVRYADPAEYDIDLTDYYL
ncbi:MAG TPA: HD-GYP domain-containing protein [Gammaproteobacteria bacterium]|nr:HD-GYP domain-containing protein [Gammaproteobacteria bacterium]